MPGYYFNINDSGDYILSNSMVYDEDKTYYRITNKNIEVLNFHQLGLKIINDTLQNKKYKPLSERHNRILNIVYHLMDDKDFKNKISTYILEYYKYYLWNEEFESKKLYYKSYREQEKLRYTIEGEIVKSFEALVVYAARALIFSFVVFAQTKNKWP